jgi:CRISPR-associated protein Csb2
MHWLCATVTFLSGHFHGSEWPPAPHRLFQAFVAGAFFKGSLNSSDIAMFKWLERLEPPQILAPVAPQGSTRRAFVPHNGASDLPRRRSNCTEEGLKGEKVYRPYLLDEKESTLHYCWPLTDEAVAELEARGLTEVFYAHARSLNALGWGIDKAIGQGRLINSETRKNLKGTLYIPEDASRGTHATMEGTFEELCEMYGRPNRTTHYEMVRRVKYVRYEAGRKRKFRVFKLTTRDGALASFPPTKAMHVAAWVRHAAHRIAEHRGLPEPFIRSQVCGHDEAGGPLQTDWMSYVALPTFGPNARDGRIRRFIMAEPYGVRELDLERAESPPDRHDAKEWEQWEQVFLGLQHDPLVDEAGETHAVLRPISETKSDWVSDQCVRGASRWSSLTPVILPGWGNIEALFRRALMWSGYTTPAEFSIHKEAQFVGGLRAGDYQVPKQHQSYLRVHATITFQESVPGPIIVGVGRHAGFGLFAARD